MPLGIRPTVDFVFKLLFGSRGNEDLLIALLNAVLQPTDRAGHDHQPAEPQAI